MERKITVELSEGELRALIGARLSTFVEVFARGGHSPTPQDAGWFFKRMLELANHLPNTYGEDGTP